MFDASHTSCRPSSPIRTSMTQKRFKSFKNSAPRMFSRYVSLDVGSASGHRYEVLSDPDSREAYDNFGMSGMGGGGGWSGGGGDGGVLRGWGGGVLGGRERGRRAG